MHFSEDWLAEQTGVASCQRSLLSQHWQVEVAEFESWLHEQAEAL